MFVSTQSHLEMTREFLIDLLNNGFVWRNQEHWFVSHLCLHGLKNRAFHTGFTDTGWRFNNHCLETILGYKLQNPFLVSAGTSRVPVSWKTLQEF